MKKVLMIVIIGLVAVLSATPGIAREIGGVDIHGFLSSGYLKGDETAFVKDSDESSFVFGEFGINFSKDLDENLRFGIQLFAKEFNDVSHNEVKIDWAYADYRLHERLGFRLGQMKFPHGLYNENRDIDMLRTSIFLPDSVYQEVSYDLYSNDSVLSMQGISSRELYLSLQGICLYGFIDLSSLGGLSYQAMYGTKKINSNITERQVQYSRIQTPFVNLSSSLFESDEVKVDYKYAGNLIWDTPMDGLRLGCSLDNIKMSASARLSEDLTADIGGNEMVLANSGEVIETKYDKLENWVFSAEYTWDNFIFVSEYILTTKDYAVGDDAFESSPLGGTSKNNISTGWYVGGTYRLLDWFELGGYYSQSRYDKNNDSDSDYSVHFFSEFDDICLTARFDINMFLAVKLEAHSLRGNYTVNNLSADFTQAISESIEEQWGMYAAKVTAAF